ncbi:sigma-54 dependent transcriptional regulator [Singulisphaera sp. Ch08]|uniref:Sigma-54 dependent transcriptional regulator n=1 Tax=Singulisphaera sp. Ch08 TaxID=3120278 RepID=A0AAU7CGW5_9BACT
MKTRLLIVHPEPSTLALLSSMLMSMGHEIDEAANDRMAVRLMERGGVDLMIAGVDPSDIEALELLAYMRRKHRQIPVILMFPDSNPERTKEALRLGALAVLKFPVPATELRAAVTQALGPVAAAQASAAVAAAAALPKPAATTPSAPQPTANPQNYSPAPAAYHRAEQLAKDWGIVGNDPSLRQAIELAASIAPMRSPVLIVGEPGTGKSLLARTLHNMGSRGDKPFINFDCTARGETWADHDPMASIPGASNGQGDHEWRSKLAQAQAGTLFLNEVSELPDDLRLQLLRVLQDREFESMNSNHNGQPDVRFLMSTSENLVGLVEQGKFRQDLYHRISVICLKLPPLRHRGTDIEQLAEYFRARFAQEFNKNVVGFTRDALDCLNKYDWPGNVRELEGVIQRGVVLSQGSRITSGHLSPSLGNPRILRPSSMAPRPHHSMSIRPLKEALEEPEKRIIIQALQALNWNRQETARVLDINRTTLYKKMKKYGLLVDGPIWVN